jgi:hypothetical protein
MAIDGDSLDTICGAWDCRHYLENNYMTFLDFHKHITDRFNPLLKKKLFLTKVLKDVEREIFLKDTMVEDMRHFKNRWKYRKLFNG